MLWLPGYPGILRGWRLDNGLFPQHYAPEKLVKQCPLYRQWIRAVPQPVAEVDTQYPWRQVTQSSAHFLPAVRIIHRCQNRMPSTAASAYSDAILAHPVSGEKSSPGGRVNTDRRGASVRIRRHKPTLCIILSGVDVSGVSVIRQTSGPVFSFFSSVSNKAIRERERRSGFHTMTRSTWRPLVQQSLSSGVDLSFACCVFLDDPLNSGQAPGIHAAEPGDTHWSL